MDSLIALAKSAWKRSVKLHHEANGGDPVAWRSANEIYSAAIKKITQSMRLGKRRFVAYNVSIAGKGCARWWSPTSSGVRFCAGTLNA